MKKKMLIAMLFLGFAYHELCSTAMCLTEPFVQKKVESKVRVKASSGKVIVSGWEKDTVTVVNKKGVTIDESSKNDRTVISVEEELEAPLDVKIPEQSSLEIEAGNSDVEVIGVKGNVRINISSGDVKTQKTGSLEVSFREGSTVIEDVSGYISISSLSGDVKTKRVKGDIVTSLTSGDMVAENIEGSVEINLTSGDLVVKNISGNLKTAAISGDANIECIKGTVEFSSASGSLTVKGNASNIEAITVSGDLYYDGTVSATGRYTLKTTSGDVKMAIPDDIPGFNAFLSSYSGDVVTDFPITLDRPSQHKAVNQRLVGKYKEGGAQIKIDSFSGDVVLTKSLSKSNDCEKIK